MARRQLLGVEQRAARSSKTVASRHNDESVYILAKVKEEQSIRRAPFKIQACQELMQMEALVGRQPPCVLPSEDYGGTRKDYLR